MWHKAVQRIFENFLLYLWAFNRYLPDTTSIYPYISIKGRSKILLFITSTARAV